MFRSIYWYGKGYAWTLIKSISDIKKIDKLEVEGKTEEREEYIYKCSRRIVKDFLDHANVKVNVEGLENIPKGPVLLVGNHQSNMDIPVIMYYIDKPKGFIAKKELEKMPILKYWMKFSRGIFIDREHPKKAMAGILEGIKHLKEGYSMVVFPEGTRSRSSKMAEFKAGSFKLATKSKVPIIPFTIDGTYKIMEANHYFIKGGQEVNLYIHPPIYTDKLTKEEILELPKKVENIVRSKLPNEGR